MPWTRSADESFYDVLLALFDENTAEFSERNRSKTDRLKEDEKSIDKIRSNIKALQNAVDLNNCPLLVMDTESSRPILKNADNILRIVIPDLYLFEAGRWQVFYEVESRNLLMRALFICRKDLSNKQKIQMLTNARRKLP